MTPACSRAVTIVQPRARPNPRCSVIGSTAPTTARSPISLTTHKGILRLPIHRCVAGYGEALLAESGGEHEMAAAGFADVATRWHGFGVPFEEAQALLGQGRCLVALGGVPEAAAPLASAREILARLGAKPALGETDDLLRRVSSDWLRRPSPRSRAPSRASPLRGLAGCVSFVFCGLKGPVARRFTCGIGQLPDAARGGGVTCLSCPRAVPTFVSPPNRRPFGRPSGPSLTRVRSSAWRRWIPDSRRSSP
jgi:hypothetical protein